MELNELVKMIFHEVPYGVIIGHMKGLKMSTLYLEISKSIIASWYFGEHLAGLRNNIESGLKGH